MIASTTLSSDKSDLRNHTFGTKTIELFVHDWPEHNEELVRYALRERSLPAFSGRPRLVDPVRLPEAESSTAGDPEVSSHQLRPTILHASVGLVCGWMERSISMHKVSTMTIMHTFQVRTVSLAYIRPRSRLDTNATFR